MYSHEVLFDTKKNTHFPLPYRYTAHSAPHTHTHTHMHTEQLLSSFPFLLFGSLTPNRCACVRMHSIYNTEYYIARFGQTQRCRHQNVHFRFRVANATRRFNFLPPLFIFRKIGNVDACHTMSCHASPQSSSVPPMYRILLYIYRIYSIYLKLRIHTHHTYTQEQSISIIFHCERERQFISDPSK